MARNYMQAYIHKEADGEITTQRSTWGGINKKFTIDSGEFTSGKMFVPYGKYIESAPIKSTFVTKTYSEILGAYGASDLILVVYRVFDGEAYSVNIDYIKSNGTIYTSVLNEDAFDDTLKRHIVQFNVFSAPTDPLSGAYSKKFLVYPDRVSFNYTVTGNNFTLTSFASGTPYIKYPVVYLSRLFGVDDSKVYASEFNNYAGWDLDTADEYLESNAWVTASQSNVKADGVFTAIAVYDGHVYCFKDDFMHQITNTKNPFRIIDIGEHGCVNNESVTECGGYLFFVSKDGVNVFSGGYPQIISDNLGITDYTDSKLASFNDVLYFYNNGTIYTYDTNVRVWGARESFIHSETTYNPVDWAEWTNRTRVECDETGATFTGNGTDYPNFRISTSLKPSTKYGILVNVLTNQLTDTTLKIGNNLTGTAITLANAAITGNRKLSFTTSSSISSNFLQIEMGIVPNGNVVKIKDVRLYELPTGSQIESDFTNLTADQLALLYPYEETMYALITNEDGVFAVKSSGVYNLNSTSYPTALGDCEFTTDLMALGITDVKRLKRLSAMVNFGANSQLDIYAVTSSGDVLLGSVSATTATTKSIRVILRKLAGDYQQLKFKIKGYVRIYNLILTYSKGGGRYDN